MKFQTSSFLKKSLLLLSIAIPSSTSCWAASRLQTRNANTSDGRSRMEVLLAQLKKVKGELDGLKEKPDSLKTKIEGYKTQYDDLIKATEVNAEIDKQFTEGKKVVDKFVENFIKAKKKEMIYDGSSSTNTK